MGLAVVTILRALSPLEEFPSEAVFIVRRVDGRIVIIVAASALTGHPTAHFGCEPKCFMPHGIRPRDVAVPEVDQVGEPQRREPARRHGDRLPGMCLHGLLPEQRVLIDRRLVLGAHVRLPAGPQLFRPKGNGGLVDLYQAPMRVYEDHAPRTLYLAR